MSPRPGALHRSLPSDATSTLLARPWRTFASAIGVMIGVASGAVTLTLAASQQAQVDRNFDQQLAPLVVLEPGPVAPGRVPLGSDPAELLPGQLDDISGDQTGGELTTWKRDTHVATSPAGPQRRATVFGATSDGIRAAGSDDKTGSLPLIDSPASHQNLAWIGADLAADIGIDERGSTGAVVYVDGMPLSVAGIHTDGTRFPSLGRAIVVNPAAAAAIWGEPEQRRFVVHVRRGSAAVVADHLVAGLDPADQRHIINSTPPDGGITRRAVGRDLERSGLTLSAVALIVGAVSVAGVMTSSVIQRTREIGLRAALGWSTWRISALIFTEAAVLGGFASVVGTTVGLAAATYACSRNGWPLVAPTYVAWLPPALGVTAGLLGGLAPAIRASQISPTEALRG